MFFRLVGKGALSCKGQAAFGRDLLGSPLEIMYWFRRQEKITPLHPH
jgi:hypothetical protein